MLALKAKSGIVCKKTCSVVYFVLADGCAIGFFLLRRKNRPPPRAAAPTPPPAIAMIAVAERPCWAVEIVKLLGFVSVSSLVLVSPLAGGIWADMVFVPEAKLVVSQVSMNVWLLPWPRVKFFCATWIDPQDTVSWKFSSVVPLL